MQENVYKTSKEASLAVALIIGFIHPFVFSSLNIALPTIGNELKMNAVMLGWVATASLLTQAILMVPCARIGDIIGRKKFFFIGMLTYIVFSTLVVYSNSGIMLIGCFAGMGIAAAINYGTIMAIFPAVYPISERGKALGIVSAAIYLGISSGPLLGGFMTEHLGWRSIFVANSIIGLSALVLGIIKLKDEWKEARGEKLDITGTFIYMIAILSIMYGFSQLPATPYIFLIVFGIGVMVLFIWWEMRVKEPILNISLFRHNISFAFSNLATLINYCATTGVAMLLSFYLQYIKGLSPVFSGFILVAQPIVMAVVSPYAGRLSDKIQPRIVASIGMALTTVSLIMLVFIDSGTPFVYIVIVLLIMGLGLGLFASPNTNAIMSAVEKKYFGIASATLGTMRTLGQVLSIAVVIILFNLLIGKAQINPENYPAFMQSAKIAFLIFAILSFAGIFSSMARGNIRK
jgi:MFS family permease